MSEQGREIRSGSICTGQIWRDRVGEACVMGIVEKYVVARRKGAIPFLRHCKQWLREFVIVEDVEDAGQELDSQP